MRAQEGGEWGEELSGGAWLRNKAPTSAPQGGNDGALLHCWKPLGLGTSEERQGKGLISRR